MSTRTAPVTETAFIPDWRTRAACRDADPEIFFPAAAPGTEAERLQVAEALTFCTGCVVRTECLQFAMTARGAAGVWGGTSEDERRVVRASLTSGAA